MTGKNLQTESTYEYMETVVATKRFMERAFRENPHYSFNDWHVMHAHSLNVYEFAKVLLRHIEADEEVTLILALLHDIGKTFHADADTLHKKHELLNLEVAGDFIESLDLSDEKRNRLEDALSLKNGSAEERIVKDADFLAFNADKRLYMLFVEWAVEKNEIDALRRKLRKIDNCNFEITRKMGTTDDEKMKRDWSEYFANKGVRI